MKFSKWILGAALLFSAQVTSVQAAGSCDPCDPCYDSNPCDLCDIDWCDVEFDFYIDALYWEVCKGDHNVAENNDGKEKYLDTCYDWGWREFDDNEDITHLGMGGMVLRFGFGF